MNTNTVEVAIIGGGMVGSTLAILLDRLGISTAVIEAAGANAAQPSFDDRTIALSYGSALLLQNMGLFNEFCAHKEPINTIQVSQRGHFGRVALSAAEYKIPALGYVLENRNIGNALQQQIQKSTVNWLAPAQVTALQVNANSVKLDYQHAASSATLNCQLLIAADGINSASCKLLGVTRREVDYGLSAVVTNVQSQLPHAGTAYEHFCREGPLAFLPLNDFDAAPRASVVMTVRHERIPSIAAMDESQLLQLLQTEFGYRLGELKQSSKPSFYKVALSYAQQLQVPRALIIGNAAQGLNPVAGQGFNLALRDVAAVLQLLSTASDKAQRDFGAPDLLAQYPHLRRDDRRATIGFTDSLIKLFAAKLPLLGHLRGAGLVATELCAPLRHKFAARGMGTCSNFRLTAGARALRNWHSQAQI